MKSVSVGAIMLGGVLGFIQPATGASSVCLVVGIEPPYECESAQNLGTYYCKAGSQGFINHVLVASGAAATCNAEGYTGTGVFVRLAPPEASSRCPVPIAGDCKGPFPRGG